MADRPLTPDEAALWARVLATVRPIRVARPAPVQPLPVAKAPPRAGATTTPPNAPPPSPPAVDLAARLKAALAAPRPKTARHAPPVPAPKHVALERKTLDGSWDRQLSRGLVPPDRAIDLHGHNLSTAYATLDAALDQAIRSGDRLILLVTGKPPRPESERPHPRGAIRAAVGDWLAGSRHASAIAAVRGAHARHGGAGALYIVLRKNRIASNY